MILAIVILLIQQMVFISYMFESSFFTVTISETGRSLLLMIGIFTAITSVPSLVWNFMMIKDGENRKNILSFIISIVTFVIGFGYVTFDYVSRIHATGSTIFLMLF